MLADLDVFIRRDTHSKQNSVTLIRLIRRLHALSVHNIRLKIRATHTIIWQQLLDNWLTLRRLRLALNVLGLLLINHIINRRNNVTPRLILHLHRLLLHNDGLLLGI